MEDYTIVNPDILGDSRYSKFCILDGHGGDTVAKFVKEHYLDILKGALSDKTTNLTIPEIIKHSIDKIENEVQKIESKDCGSTFCGILFDLKQKKLWTINVGDSRALKMRLSNTKQVEFNFLTAEHKTSNQDELKRIEAVGGSIINGRLAGNLMVTRALGDFDFKTMD